MVKHIDISALKLAEENQLIQESDSDTLLEFVNKPFQNSLIKQKHIKMEIKTY